MECFSVKVKSLTGKKVVLARLADRIVCWKNNQDTLTFHHLSPSFLFPPP